MANMSDAQFMMHKLAHAYEQWILHRWGEDAYVTKEDLKHSIQELNDQIGKLSTESFIDEYPKITVEKDFWSNVYSVKYRFDKTDENFHISYGANDTNEYDVPAFKQKKKDMFEAYPTLTAKVKAAVRSYMDNSTPADVWKMAKTDELLLRMDKIEPVFIFETVIHKDSIETILNDPLYASVQNKPEKFLEMAATFIAAYYTDHMKRWANITTV